MKYFIARLIFKVKGSSKGTLSTFDEQFRFLIANDESAAFQKALEIGKCESTEFLNVAGDTICWEFMNVDILYEIAELSNGSELFSFTHETREGNGYMQAVQAKAHVIKERNSISLSMA